MSVHISPLPCLSWQINVQESTRSVAELRGNQKNTQRCSAADVVLNHPPVLTIAEGGGERLLNYDAVNKQLSYYNGLQKNEYLDNLRCWIIDPKVIGADNDVCLLYAFVFGQLQRLYYVKKQRGIPLWKIVMQQVEKDEHLKNIIEKNLFDGDDLAPRHYQVLLMAAQVGESSINRELGKIRRKNVRKSEKDTSEMSAEKSSSVADFSHKEENKKLDNEQQPKNNKSFDMSESLANLKSASEKGSVTRDKERSTAGRDE